MVNIKTGPIAVETLSTLTPDALRMLESLVIQSYWNQTPHDLAVFSLLGTLYVVRDQQNDIIASGAVLPMGETAAWISLILVAPHARGQGLGRAIFEHCLNAVQDMGRTAMLDATPAGEALYAKFGFEPLWRLTRWQRGAIIDAVPGEPSTLSKTAPSFNYLAAKDAEALGFLRTLLLSDLAMRHGSQVKEQNQAFTIVRAGRIARHIGPLLANHESAAAALLRTIANSEPGPLFIDVPDARPLMRQQLIAAGFTEQRGFARMARGSSIPSGETAFIHAIAGPEFG